MKLKDLKITARLFIGFAAILFLVICLFTIAYIQSDKIAEQTDQIYNHPLKVRRAIGALEKDILQIRIEVRELMVIKNETDKQNSIIQIAAFDADAHKQLDILKAQYLGSESYIDELGQAYMKWFANTNEDVKLIAKGQIQQALKNLSEVVAVGTLRGEMIKKIKSIDSYAIQKADFICQNSKALNERLNKNLIYLSISIFVFMLLISYWLVRSIRNPIKELSGVTKRFEAGDFTARSEVDTRNEFGELSKSFNSMVENIQRNLIITDMTASFAQLMLVEEHPHAFFSSILPALANHTNSQMAAVYLLSDDKKRYEHFYSFGMVDMARQSFAVDNYEGEFGTVLSTRKMHIIKRIPKDTRFVFHTVSGKLVPREIITIPIIFGNEIIAIISLASVRAYTDQTLQFIDNTLYTFSSRIEGILSFQKLQELSMKLATQNTELEAQKTEMEAQSVELKAQNRELEVQKSMLSEANVLKTNFLSNMSHELRTPLNSVIALSGVLNRRLASKIPAEEFSFLEVIERNGKHLLSLINDILDISRIESGREEVEITHFSVENLIADLITMIQPQAQQKGIELLQPNNNYNCIITSDVTKCRHILQNLIANAVKFKDTGKVEISVVQNDEKIEINVTDTGIGIDNNHLEHIFDEFRQADGSTSRRYGGTGLGLAIAKKYANLLGGTVIVKSEIGVGSTFTLVLPLNYSNENQAVEVHKSYLNIKPAVTPVTAQNNTPKTILLVDDSEPALIQMKDFLSESGSNILVAHTGEEALNIISKTIPDAMVLDLMMPGVDGFEVLESIRNANETAQIPVLILTAKHLTKDDLKNLKRNNVHQLVQKGDVNRLELLQAIADLFPQPVKTSPVATLNQATFKGKPTILIVEDNMDNMTMAKAVIANKFNIIEATDGNDGIEKAKKYQPHLILMDISLPGIDGIETFKVIRQHGELSHIPVVALTASAMTIDRELILSHGFDGFLAKPIDEKQFFKTIDEVLFGK